jgi:hypothetical protein
MRSVSVRRNSTRENPAEEWVDIQVISMDELDANEITAGTELNFLVAAKVTDWENVGLMFGPMEKGELLILLEPDVWNWPKLLVRLKCFPSASQAAKNYKAQGKSLDFRKGFTDFHIGKARKIRISLWDPYMPEKM